jgi:chromosome segregation ATPase
MTRTKEKRRTVEAVERELEAVRERLEELRAELREASEAPQISWDGVTPETLERIGRADTKRAALPVAIDAGEVRELELSRELAGLRAPAAGEDVERCYEAMQAADERRRLAEKEYEAARFAWDDAVERARALEMEERRLAGEIAGRKAAADHGRKTLSAPVVRSVWQQFRGIGA